VSKLVELNRFTRGTNGVFQTIKEQREFDYSDGEASEKKLYKILSTAKDLSSTSVELESQIVDWPTEYHLSGVRSNLLRPLNLDGVVRVLELGCGCGSITRYLGEQDGIHVDAIEGSPTRAGLAALRCRDLANVSISTANFNEIKVPENYYDLVLFIGVTEYAGRFSEQNSDEAALADLLELGKRASSKNGAVIIAIENRLGLKYLLGASEDHYGVPFVGIDHYPKSTGIRTYSRDEWIEHTANFKKARFLYPFPDYKLPTMLVNETSMSELGESAEPIRSRDYLKTFDLGEDEYRAWQGLAQAGTLAQHANSFLIVLSDQPSIVESICDFSIERYPNKPLPYPVEKREPLEKHDSNAFDTMERHLNAEITQLKSHSQSLESRVDIMSGSIGWRVLNVIRRLFGKTTI